jgi:hypothetical protein
MEKIMARSYERYNGGVAIKRKYGSATVTMYCVWREGRPEEKKLVKGFGATSADRRADAIRRYKEGGGDLGMK